MKYYAAMLIKHSHAIETPFGQQALSLSFADGMVGVIPVFTNKRKAKKYCADKFVIAEFDGIKTKGV
jgi:hypothetical protein